MKRLWTALCLLAAMAAGVFFHYRAVEALGLEVIALLERAESAAAADDWVQAERLNDEAAVLWNAHSVYLNMTMRHSDTNQICSDLAETRALLCHREMAEYAAANARLRNAVRTLYETERLTLKNLL